MFKFHFVILAVIFFWASADTISQHRFLFQLGGGVAIPLEHTKGNFAGPTFNGTGIDTSFIRRNYGGGLGFNFFAAFKYGIDKKAFSRLVILGSFNSFYNRSSGFVNESGYLFPARHFWNLNFTNIGFGLELAPIPGPVTPFINANIMLTVMSANLTTESSSLPDETRWRETLRIGANGNAGFEIKTSKKFGIVLGAMYNFHNLFFKDNDNYNHANFGKKEIGFNDFGGYYFSNLYTGGFSQIYEGLEKNLNSLSIYAGLTFYFEPSKKKPKKTDR